MSFLDRFKAQPKYRNPDPAIRLAGLAELPDDAESWGVIAELAASDEDVRVRRAAIGRIGAAGYLARLARTERDEALKRELCERLVAIANAAGRIDSDAATALEGLSDHEHLGAVAKSSPHETVRTAALGRIQDAKIAGQRRPARRDPKIALAAVARVSDPAELLAVATATEHKDAGLAALECGSWTRLASDADRRSLLDGVATRAKNKAVAKRARALMQEMDEAGGGAESGARRGAEAHRADARPSRCRGRRTGGAPMGCNSSRSWRNAWRRAGAERRRAGMVAQARSDARLAEGQAAIAAREREEAERREAAARAEERRARVRRAVRTGRGAAGRRRAGRDLARAGRMGRHARRQRAGAARRRAARALRRGLPARRRAAGEPSGDRTRQRAARASWRSKRSSCRSSRSPLWPRRLRSWPRNRPHQRSWSRSPRHPPPKLLPKRSRQRSLIQQRCASDRRGNSGCASRSPAADGGAVPPGPVAGGHSGVAGADRSRRRPRSMRSPRVSPRRKRASSSGPTTSAPRPSA